MSCCQNGSYVCHLCKNKKCKNCLHMLIDSSYACVKGCYCDTCMQEYPNIWVSCFGCDERVYMATKSKYTILDLYLMCDECEIKKHLKNKK